MSMIFMDGFDHYGAIRRKWTVTSGFDNPTFVAGRFGGQALKKQFQNAVGTVQKGLGGNQTEVFWGMAFKPPGMPTAESMWRLKDSAGATVCSVQINSANNTISIVAGGFISTSPNDAITVGSWQYIEVHYIPKNVAGAGGIAELRVDEVVVATIDGALYKTTTGNENVLTFQFTDNGTNSPRYLYDDFYILNGDGAENNDYLGDIRISVLYPKADGGINTMNPLSGVDNYAMVNETISDGSTSYVDSKIIGASEDYVNQTFTDIGVTPSAIHAVQVNNMALKTDVGAISFKNEMIIAAARYTDGVTHVAVSGNYFSYQYVSDTDPSDSGAWTEAKVDAVGSGISIVTPV